MYFVITSPPEKKKKKREESGKDLGKIESARGVILGEGRHAQQLRGERRGILSLQGFRGRG